MQQQREKFAFSEGELAVRLNFSKAALRKWRKQGRGPRFVRLESKIIRYLASDVEIWLQAHATGPAGQHKGASNA
jgi:predicted DNA-binding transcriptional regulator AlpA